MESCRRLQNRRTCRVVNWRNHSTANPISDQRGWLRWKTPLFLALVIFSNLAGDVCLRFGLRQTGNLLAQPFRAEAHVLLGPWVCLGISFYLIWMLAQMALFSWADLSYIVPIASLGYALAALAGKLLLREFISTGRWVGITLIVLGVVLVSRTAARTTRQRKGLSDR